MRPPSAASLPHPGLRLELAVSTVRAWGLRKGSALWPAQAAAGNKPESPKGGSIQVGARAIGTVSGCCGCRRGRVRVPKLFARKTFVFFIANVFVVLFTVRLICLELENYSYVIVYTTVSTI